ncbi:hypothetical protein [Halorussus aquaticus]|uniref:Uncharacterized protein n=1 Tax=Halorussus aquaticus TaxID=2953748 RepID=A0ABD5Q0B3_9EURY|nr:hypothetical protein [Halorussus aquaticus]
MPSKRPLARHIAARICGLFLAVAFVGAATAQSGVGPTPDLDIELRFLGALLVYLLLGAR